MPATLPCWPKLISIHAPREGSDLAGVSSLCLARMISIHAPREGSDRSSPVQTTTLHRFLSTLPARGATTWNMIQYRQEVISIHAPREGSDMSRNLVTKSFTISIHAPREGSDKAGAFGIPYFAQFLSTLPARGATSLPFPTSCRLKEISIHAPREGSDDVLWAEIAKWMDFYPRSPRGERRFLCTNLLILRPISIHAPREGSDGATVSRSSMLDYFYPRSPRGERHPARLHVLGEL